MGRAAHTIDSLLDATRAVVLRDGPRATTVAAVAAEAGAPVGSIYHRFVSLDEMLARTWLRAVRGTQGAHRSAASTDVADLALAHYDYCVAHREDVLLLELLRAHDIAGLRLGTELAAEVAAANQQTRTAMRQLAEHVLGRVDRQHLDLLKLAVIDLPYAFAQDYLHMGRTPPAARRERLPATVRAVLAGLVR
jgi:AcrR family transcriptional regulator